MREYANDPAELVAKQMAFTRAATVKIAQAVVDAMDEMSMPLQEAGMAQMLKDFEEWGKSKPKPKKK